MAERQVACAGGCGTLVWVSEHFSGKMVCWRCRVKQKAAELWAGFDDAERACVRVGMLPAEKMWAAEREGYDGRLLAVALYDCAKRDGGMVV